MLKTTKTKRKCAVFTIVRNEADFLPIWYKYYSSQVDPQDIYILDHETTDGSTQGLNTKLVTNDLTQDFSWLKRVTSDYQAELLKKYEAVLFTNVDEIICPDPAKYSGLLDFLSKNNDPTFRCCGYELLHFSPEEAPIQKDAGILQQRKYWYENSGVYGKPLLTRVPFTWTAGWHRVEGDDTIKVNYDLRLIHLHRMDYDMCHFKHERFQKEKIHEGDQQKKWGWHLYVPSEDYAKWFYSVKAAKILFAEGGFKEYEQNKNNTLDQIKRDAQALCVPIEDRWKSVV